MADSYTIADVARATHCGRRVIESWIDRGVLRAEGPPPGRGQARRLSLRWAAIASVLGVLHRTFGPRFPFGQVAAVLAHRPEVEATTLSRAPRGFDRLMDRGAFRHLILSRAPGRAKTLRAEFLTLDDLWGKLPALFEAFGAVTLIDVEAAIGGTVTRLTSRATWAQIADRLGETP